MGAGIGVKTEEGVEAGVGLGKGVPILLNVSKNNSKHLYSSLTQLMEKKRFSSADHLGLN